MQSREFSHTIGEKTLTVIISDLAEKAHGSVLMRYGNTAVLATVVMSKQKRDGIDFFPLVVDYEERFYAAGEILGSRFIRREGRPSEDAILGGRIVDRTIRPLFKKHIRNEVQVVITVLAIDEDDPDMLAINAASLALGISDIPWDGPVAAVRIGKQKEEEHFTINPSYSARDEKKSLCDAMVCGKEGIVNMIEIASKEISEEEIARALEHALREIASLERFQKEIINEIGKEKREIPEAEIPKELMELFEKEFRPQLSSCVFSPKGKTHVDVKKEWLDRVKEVLPESNTANAADYYEHIIDDVVHAAALEEDTRVDSRGMDEIRPLYAHAGGISPVLHGVGIFYRGGTHVLSILTLGGPKDALLVDSMEVQEGEKHFMHHYNFPPFAPGETGRIGGINRRMIGHGALAEKALSPVIPQRDEFPYTIRLVSEVLASNGSTSMASVCASTLALMDAGVPIKAPVAGIAMGLMLENQKSEIRNSKQAQNNNNQTKYKILTDIQGPEDHHGDMDFKVAGTRQGVTAVQMDVKVEGIPIQILKESLEKARRARCAILDTIEAEVPHPRKELSPRAPRIIKKKIQETQIGLVIGPSGQTIKRIVRETGADIDIEEDGTVFIIGKNGSAEKASEMLEEIVHEYVPGERFEGEVTRILDFGAFVKVSPYAEGLVHVSEFAPEHIERPSDLVKVGDRVPVVVKEVDEKGRLNLSIKRVNQEFFKGRIPQKNHSMGGHGDRRPFPGKPRR